jgi:signal transduction histidine kinase
VVVDLVLCAVVAAAVTVAISAADEPGSRPPDALAYGLGLLIAGLLLVRRRWPLGVLLATAIALLCYYSLTYPAIPPALPLAAALFTAAAAGRLRWSLLVIAFYTAADLVVPLIHQYQPPLVLLAQVTERTLGMVALALLGETVRNRRMRLAAADERLRLATMERSVEAARRVADERLRIAREVHDILGHTVSAISIQAGLADELLERRPAEARSAVQAIRTASREALGELRAAIGALRVGETVTGRPSPPAPGLNNLDAVLESAKQAGLQVELLAGHEDGGPPIPSVVDVTAYRIVQESLTNVVRHAQAGLVTVALSRDGDDLVIEVTDDGCGAQESDDGNLPRPGHGLVGMTERVSLLGGRLCTGNLPDRGFRVSASLPINRVSPDQDRLDGRRA